MDHRSQALARCLLAGAAVLASAGACEAQSRSDGAVLSEIIVTAQKRAERLDDVPLSVTAASGAELTARGVTHPADLEKVVPGFTYVETTYGAPIYNLRGVGYFDEALASPPAVTVYVDQAPLPFSAMTLGAGLDPERVEILKGPQGTLFGQNSTGGAVNYVPSQPTWKRLAEAAFTFGRFDERDFEGHVSGPLTDALAARFAVRLERRDGSQENVGAPGSNGARDFSAARLLLDWKPGDRWRFNLNLNGWIDRSDDLATQKIGYSPLTPLAAGGYPDSPGLANLQANLMAFPMASKRARQAGFDPGLSLRRDDRFGQVALRSEVDVGGVTITSLSSFAHEDIFQPNDLDGTPFPDLRIDVVGEITSYAEELRANGESFAGRLKWVGGLNYADDTVQDIQDILLNGTNSGFGAIRFNRLANRNNQSIQTAAVFGGLDYRLTQTVSLQASLRYTDRWDRFRGCLSDAGTVTGGIRDGFAALSSALSGTTTVIAPGACVTLGDDNKPVDIVRRKLDEANWSYRFGASWRATPETLVYATISRGYKAGSFDNLPAIRPAQLDPVRQEALEAYEAGIRTRWPAAQVALDAAVYHYDYEGKQIAGYVNTGPPFGLLPALISVPKSYVNGAEAALVWSPLQDLKLRTSVAYVDSRVHGSVLTSAPLGGTVDIGGEAFPNAPKWQVAQGLSFERSLSANLRGFLEADLTYRSATSAAFGGDPLFRVPAYALLDLRAGMEPADGRWRLEVWGHNVTDRFYWTTVAHVEDTVTRLAGMPATWGVTLTARLEP